MSTRDRRRARAITKSQRQRRQNKPVKRAIELLVASSHELPFAGIQTLLVAPGETVRVGDAIYTSSEYPSRATARQRGSEFELGVAIAAIGDAVTVRLHHRA